jgi:hypothetical protein
LIGQINPFIFYPIGILFLQEFSAVANILSEIAQSVEDLFRSSSSSSQGINPYILLNQREQLTSMSQPLSAQEDDQRDEVEPYGEPIMGGGGRDRSASRLSAGSQQGRQGIVIIDDEDEDEHDLAHTKTDTKKLIEESLDFDELESTIWKKVLTHIRTRLLS